MKTIIKATLIVFITIILAFSAAAKDSPLYADTVSIALPKTVEKSIEIGSTDNPKLRIVDVRISSPRSTKFTFVSDDGSENDYIYRDIFASRGVSMVVPVVEDYVTGKIGSIQIPLEQLLVLQNDYGFEIGSHTMTHKKLSTLDDEEMLYQLSESKKSLNRMGLKVNNIYFPFGDYNDKVVKVASEIYRASRTSDLGNNKILDKTKLKTYWIDEGLTNLADAKKYVDSAISEDHGYVIFSYHSTTATESHMQNTVGALVEYILSQSGTQILTLDKALDRIENLAKIGEDVKIINGKVILDKFFARSLPVGLNILEIKFSDGSTGLLKINVNNASVASYRYATEDAVAPLPEKAEEIIPSSELKENPKVTEESTVSVNLSDIEGHWAQATIEALVSKGIINGYADGTFQCENNINTDEFIKIVVCSMGYEVKQDETYWAKNYISKARQLGLIEEGDFTEFSTPINRYQMTKIIIMSIIDEGMIRDTSEARARVSDFKFFGEYVGYVLQAVSKGIITGYPDGCFHGDRFATRAEAAVIIERAIDSSKRKTLEY